MAQGRATRKKMARVVLLIIVAILMAACNLGQQIPAEPTLPSAGGQTAPEGQLPQADVTPTPLLQVPPTDVPTPQLLPSEQISAIVIDGTDHRALVAITIRVRRGTAVSSTICNWTLQDTGQTGSLGAPASSTQLDPNIIEDVYSFTPDTGGTFVIRCSGNATTASGVRTVEAASATFLVQQKG